MEDMEIQFYVGDDFPLIELATIRTYLESAHCLVPGYAAPKVGILALEAIRFSEDIEGWETTILIDRNLASRFAKIARDGGVSQRDEPTQIAVHLMAFAQIMGLNFEPSVSSHELASLTSNQDAWEDLAWFRAADAPNPGQWIDLALQRRDTITLPAPSISPRPDLAFPLHRWRRNYIAALKIAELEVTDTSPIERFEKLVVWMRDEFLLAGPAASYAAMYFSPRAAKSGMFKGLRSKVPGTALKGIRNAAWDMTHLSEFGRRAHEGEEGGKRYWFATADRALAELARKNLEISAGFPDSNKAAQVLSEWWPSGDAVRVATAINETIIELQNDPSRRPSFSPDMIEEMIRCGEANFPQ